MKKASGRKQDLSDIELLKKLKEYFGEKYNEWIFLYNRTRENQGVYETFN